MSKKASRTDFEKAANIIRDAGGEIIGRTRLQKIAYLLELAGVGEGFVFEYRHYGPYSEDLSMATQIGKLFDELNEEERQASWGGKYSIFTSNRGPDDVSTDERKNLARAAASADAVELELAATAAFLSSEGENSPWQETARRKSDKISGGRLERAKLLYANLQQIETPTRLPNLN
jgi:uncharacterized protein YwgA